MAPALCRAQRMKEDNVGRRIMIVVLIVLVLAALATAVGIGAYHAGYNNGIIDTGHMARVVPDGGYYMHPGWGFGFFPGFFIFPLVVLLLIALVFWRRPLRRWWGYGHCGPAGWASGGPRQAFDVWHREAHAQPAPRGGETAAGPPQTPPADAAGQPPEEPPESGRPGS